jgi:hypothetical protein
VVFGLIIASTASHNMGTFSAPGHGGHFGVLKFCNDNDPTCYYWDSPEGRVAFKTWESYNIKNPEKKQEKSLAFNFVALFANCFAFIFALKSVFFMHLFNFVPYRHFIAMFLHFLTALFIGLSGKIWSDMMEEVIPLVAQYVHHGDCQTYTRVAAGFAGACIGLAFLAGQYEVAAFDPSSSTKTDGARTAEEGGPQVRYIDNPYQESDNADADLEQTTKRTSI